MNSSLIDRLRFDIAKFAKQVDEHISKCSIELRNDIIVPGVVVLAPEFAWVRSDPSDQLIEKDLDTSFRAWWPYFAQLFSDGGDGLKVAIDTLLKSWETWIHRTHYFDLGGTVNEARHEFNYTVSKTVNYLDELSSQKKAEVILVADTNALLTCPDVSFYGDNIDEDNFTVVITSTVLGELDKLKYDKLEAVRNGAEAAIKRIKGLRNQGDILAGVTINKTIKVKLVPDEPDFKKSPKALDPMIKDDRIIASILQIQKERPVAVVVLVSGDINMQTKCAGARIPFIEPPQRPRR